MKRMVAIILSIAMLLSIITITAAADEASDIKAIQKMAYHADYFYGGLCADYVRDYVGGELVDENSEDFDQETYTHPRPAAEVDSFLQAHFALTDALYAEVREVLQYDEATDVYNLPFVGGSGGFMNKREFVSYVKNSDGSYTLYYETINWIDLPQSEYDKMDESGDFPDEVTYDGKVYKAGPDGYLYHGGYKDGGLAHTFSVNDGVVRFLSTEAYTGTKVTEATTTTTTTTTTATAGKDTATTTAVATTGKVTTTTKRDPVTTVGKVTTATKPTTTTTAAQPIVEKEVAKVEGLVVKTAEDVFPQDAVVTVEKVAESAPVYQTVVTALQPVAEKFVAYEITAAKDNVAVQPNGTVTATFDIPDDFDAAKTVVLYVADDGTAEKLSATIDEQLGTITATLTHFSTYVVAESTREIADGVIDGKDDATIDMGSPEDLPSEQPQDGFPWWIVIVVVVVLAGGGAAAWYFLIYKKK